MEKAAKDVRACCKPAAGRTDPSLLTVCVAIRENIVALGIFVAGVRRPIVQEGKAAVISGSSKAGR